MTDRRLKPLLLAAACLLLLASFAAPARADTTRVLGDWTASCWTRQERCAAETDADEGTGRRPYRLTLSLARRDGPETGWEIGFRLRNVTPEGETAIRLQTDEGERFRFDASGYALTQSGRFVEFTDGNEVARLLPALRAGRRLAASFTSAEHGAAEAGFSLQGLTSALSWIDEQQNRVGSSDRIAAVTPSPPPEETAEAPAKAVEAPAEPVEAAAEPSEMPEKPAETAATAVEAPAKPAEAPPAEVARLAPETPPAVPVEAPAAPAEVLAKHLAKSECEPLEGALADRRWTTVAPLSENKSLYVIPCFAGAYNIAYRLYVVRNNDIATMRTLYFANYSRSLGWYGSDTLINVSYDAETGMLSAFGKGRGLGDCGNSALYRWEGFDFKMLEYRAWDRCDGSRPPERWPVVYKAEDKDAPAAALPAQ